MDQDTSQRFRRDGWTPARQLRFLDTLGRTRSVTRAAAAAGMSRESAYRLRKRDPGGLFPAAWDHAVEGHNLTGNPRTVRRNRETNSRGNPPKVTKWKKWKDPRFGPLTLSLL